MKIKVIRTLQIKLTERELEAVMIGLTSLSDNISYSPRPDVIATVESMQNQLNIAINDMGGLNV